MSCWLHLTTVFGVDQRQAFYNKLFEGYLADIFPLTDAEALLNRQPIRGYLDSVYTNSCTTIKVFIGSLS